ncbi:MAG: hypothetical protein WCQ66_07905 [Sphaerochaetaceae bacterium]|jgi:hypothetical protein
MDRLTTTETTMGRGYFRMCETVGMQYALAADDIKKTGTMFGSRPTKRSPKDKENG